MTQQKVPTLDRQDQEKRTLGFAAHFNTISLIAILLAVTGIAAAHYWISIQLLTDVTEAHNESLAKMMANHIDEDMDAPHSHAAHANPGASFKQLVESTKGLRPERLREHPAIRQLHHTVERMIAHTPVYKLKLYAPSGTTLYSTSAAEIGGTSIDDQTFLQALQIGTRSTLHFNASDNASARYYDVHNYVETYVPVGDSGNPSVRPQLVFEIYYNAEHELKALRHSVAFTSIASLVILTMVYFLLSYVVRPADRIMRRQYHENRRLTRAIDQTASMVVITDAKGVIKYVNPRFTEVTGYARDEAVGQTPRILRSGKTQNSTYQQMWDTILAGDIWKGEILNRTKGGNSFWEYQTITPIRNERGKIHEFVAIKEDITERKLARERIDHLALFDSLTDLPNRAHFMDRIGEAIAFANRGHAHLAVIYLDLDDFKDVNDTLGHHAGDDILRRAADRMTATVRDMDLLARIGGDEFAVLALQIANENDAANLAERLISSVQAPFTIEESEIFIGASAGIAIYPQDGSTGDQLLRNADLALYRSKQQGRNTYHFYEAAMDTKVLQGKLLAKDLHLALEHGELELHYQPAVDLHTGEIRYIEALLRWNHPTRGIIYPDEFIGIAEHTRLIVPIGEWVMREACRQTREWQDAGLGHHAISVNLSLVQFQHANLHQEITDILRNTGLEPKRLMLEFTEGVTMSEDVDVTATFARLRDLGIGIALDDFGTGYSPLNCVRQLPIDRIKIDGSFLPKSPTDDAALSLLRAIYQLSSSLRQEVTAEGVETEGQVEMLVGLGIREIQGNHVCAACNADELATFLESR